MDNSRDIAVSKNVSIFIYFIYYICSYLNVIHDSSFKIIRIKILFHQYLKEYTKLTDFDEDNKKNIKLLPQQDPTSSTTNTNIMEPLVQIKSEPTTAEETIEETMETSERDVHYIQNATEPEVQIIEESGNLPVMPIVQTEVNQDSGEKPVKTEHRSFFENIGLFENSNTVAKIGECTISVSNSTGSSIQTVAKNVGID